MRTAINLTGQRFGKLTVIRSTLERKGGGLMWLCRCDCGQEALVRSYLLRAGMTTSCGCLKRLNPNAFTHGQVKTRIYWSWAHMKGRCLNPKDTAFRNYGGRGIKVCKRWLRFLNFASDMGPMPAGKTIERKNNNGNYTPKNCKWATRSEQAFNRRPYKLTKTDVRKIRQAAAKGERQNSIAARFGVHQTHVSNIVNFKRKERG